ncbi:MAG TPA: nucleotide exchange factor GrpE, partial [Candidatus Eisenbacteria bacterium]|nr:nucleotide exchange factor GrpE [Candidatus Eisenbacteria bacterium]
LMQVLRREGLEPIQSKGAPFDPSVHDAIAVAKAPANVAPGTVIEEASPGYRFKDRVLRHAKVIVADGPPSAEHGHAKGGPADSGEAAS